jgi:hypothetical protein
MHACAEGYTGTNCTRKKPFLVDSDPTINFKSSVITYWYVIDVGASVIFSHCLKGTVSPDF